MNKNHITLILLFFIVSCSLFEDEQLPNVKTKAISNITQNSAITGGEIISDGNVNISECGICFNINNNPTILDSRTSDIIVKDEFNSELTGLLANTTYYYCAYATNKVGTSYGEINSFKTLPNPSSPVFDIDGNMYETVTIGTQVWLNKNLKTTKLNDGTPIALVTSSSDWGGLSSPAYCIYVDKASNKDIYGVLYNWDAVNTDKLCPVGYHVPTKSEWETLQQYLGGSQVAGGKMKETGYIHWLEPNDGATNSSGFNALPSGYRGGKMYYLLGTRAIYWSSTSYDASRAHAYELSNENDGLIWSGFESKTMGFSVRCIKNK